MADLPAPVVPPGESSGNRSGLTAVSGGGRTVDGGTSWRETLAQSWTRRGPLSWLLWPLSVVYGVAVTLRRWLYRLGIYASHKLDVPVLVVGNVVAGGAGKTPVVILLVAHLRARGVRVGVISRGYGRDTLDCREVLRDSSAQSVGDEPKLVKQVTGAPVFVAIQRHEAAAALLAKYPRTQLIICDDGLQHYGLQRDIEICVFDNRGLGNGFLMPAGPLREPWPRHSWIGKFWPHIVHFVLHTGDAPAVDGGYNAPRTLADFGQSIDGIRIALADLAGKPLLAVAAIAQPENFFAMLRSRGLTLEHTIALPDHYDFDGWLCPFSGTHTLICTQKDAVKLWPRHREALAVPLVLDPEAEFLNELDVAINSLLKHK